MLPHKTGVHLCSAPMGQGALIQKCNHNGQSHFGGKLPGASSQENYTGEPCQYLQEVVDVNPAPPKIYSLSQQAAKDEAGQENCHDSIPLCVPAHICHKKGKKGNDNPHLHIAPGQEAQHIIAVEIVSRQHTDEKAKGIDGSPQRGGGIDGKNGAQQHPDCQPPEIITKIQPLHNFREMIGSRAVQPFLQNAQK